MDAIRTLCLSVYLVPSIYALKSKTYKIFVATIIYVCMFYYGYYIIEYNTNTWIEYIQRSLKITLSGYVINYLQTLSYNTDYYEKFIMIEICNIILNIIALKTTYIDVYYRLILTNNIMNAANITCLIYNIKK